MLQSYRQLKEIVRQGFITNVLEELINGTSIDITLGKMIMIEQPSWKPVVLNKREQLPMKSLELGSEGYLLKPGEFILAHSEQVFNLPLWLSAEYKLKSSMARIGLEHMNAGWCDAGWNGSVLTLELCNCSQFSPIELHMGDRIGQVVFFSHELVPEESSYKTRGRYNGDLVCKGAKLDPKELIEVLNIEMSKNPGR